MFPSMSDLADIDEDTQNAWFLGSLPDGVIFSMCHTVRVVSGGQKGKVGEVISLYSLHPEPLYHVEAGDGSDIIIRQSGLEAYDGK